MSKSDKIPYCMIHHQNPVYFGSPKENRQSVKGKGHATFGETNNHISGEFDSSTLSNSMIESSIRLRNRFMNSKNTKSNKNIIVISTLLTCLRENLPILENLNSLRDYEGELIIVSCIKSNSRDSLEALRKLLELGVNLDVTIEGETILNYSKKFKPKSYQLLEKAFEKRKQEAKFEPLKIKKPIVTLTESDKEHIAILFQKDITTNFGVKFGSFSDTLEDLKYFVKCETMLV